MWLGESDDGWWPGQLQEFFDNVEGVTNYEGQTYSLLLTTRVPLKSPTDYSQAFLHGQKPIDGKGPPVHTIVMPLLTEEVAGMDPLEVLLNPEISSI